jgi:hypothetical protein
VGDTVLLLVRPELSPLRVPAAAIRELYVSRGRPSRVEAAARNAWLPAVLAGASGGVMASIGRGDDDRGPGRAALQRAASAAIFAGAMGAAFPKERWRRIWRAGGE